MPLLIVMLVLGGVAHIANRIFVPDAVAVVLPIAFLLNGLGYVFILRIDLGLRAELRAAAGGVDGRRRGRLRPHPDLHPPLAGPRPLPVPLPRRRRRPPAPPLAPHPVGSTINGARLWVRFGTFQFQPVEVAKILLCIFFASYFAEKREL